jgi:hypothetical protein
MSSNRRPEEDNTNTNAVDDNVKRLLKDGIRGKIHSSTIAELRRRYKDDNLIDKIEEVFYERLNEIKTRARKFAKLVEKKFGAKGLPLHIVLKESKRYKDKYNLDEIEFDEFRNQYQRLLNSRLPIEEQMELVPNTNMAQLFGDINSNEGIVLKDSDYPVLQDIAKMYTMTRTTHSSVILQSMQYEDCAPEVLNGMFDPQKHNPTSSIHPIVAAMFIPKIQLFEEHFLYTNIAYIIKSKHERQPLNNMADINLLHHMINDAADVVCSADTPLKDLRLRCNLQNNLWNNVLSLRTGKFFDAVGNDFFAAIDECKISSYDAPDLLYVGDEGIVLKRLLSAFSFRPLVVTTNPIFGTYGTANPVNFPVITNRVVASPLLTLRLPPNSGKNQMTINLESALTQSQVYLENGMFVPKTQEVIFTKGVVIFHVPRRTISPDKTYKNLISPIPQFDQIPSHVLRTERVNDTPISVDETISIRQEPYYLRSAVFLETFNEASAERGIDQIVISTGALIRKSNNPVTGDFWVYSPRLANSESGKSEQLMQRLYFNNPESDDPIDLLSTRATIFIYAKNYNA